MIKKKSSFIFISEGRYGVLGDVFNDYDILPRTCEAVLRGVCAGKLRFR
jgi:hypothetical protein